MSIKVNLKVFLFAIIFYFTKQIEIYAILMIFGIIHELGHLICGLVLGLKPKSLKIMPLGFSIEFKILTDYYNKKVGKGNTLDLKKLLIALGGPITNFIIVIICIVSKNKFGIPNLEYIIYPNILIGLFNLLPIYPMDGGRVIKYVLNMCIGKKYSIEYVNKMSNISIILITAISSILIYYYKNISILFIVVYLWCLAINENKKYNTRVRLYKIIDKCKKDKQTSKLSFTGILAKHDI